MSPVVERLCIEVGYKGVYISRTCFRDEMVMTQKAVLVNVFPAAQ